MKEKIIFFEEFFLLMLSEEMFFDVQEWFEGKVFCLIFSCEVSLVSVLEEEEKEEDEVYFVGYFG